MSIVKENVCGYYFEMSHLIPILKCHIGVRKFFVKAPYYSALNWAIQKRSNVVGTIHASPKILNSYA